MAPKSKNPKSAAAPSLRPPLPLDNVPDDQPLPHLEPQLDRDLQTLAGQEEQILARLNQDPRLARLFLVTPAEALGRMGISVPPALLHRLKAQPPLGDVFLPREYRLPNGQTLRPRVRVRFSSGRG